MADLFDLFSTYFESQLNRREVPSRAMIDAGNYKKKHVRFAEMNITIENPKGSIRSGVGDGGKPWSVKMNHDYGYIKRSVGADGENVDCFLGPNENAGHVYVIHQKKPKTGEYDEDKCMIGFDSEAEAKSAYLSNYSSPNFLGPISTMPVEQFKKMCADGTNGQIVKWNNKHASKASDFIASGFDFSGFRSSQPRTPEGKWIDVSQGNIPISSKANQWVREHLTEMKTKTMTTPAQEHHHIKLNGEVIGHLGPIDTPKGKKYLLRLGDTKRYYANYDEGYLAAHQHKPAGAHLEDASATTAMPIIEAAEDDLDMGSLLNHAGDFIDFSSGEK